jgi:hypothetical protein
MERLERVVMFDLFSDGVTHWLASKMRGSFPFAALRVEDDGEKQATAKALQHVQR